MAAATAAMIAGRGRRSGEGEGEVVVAVVDTVEQASTSDLELTFLVTGRVPKLPSLSQS